MALLFEIRRRPFNVTNIHRSAQLGLTMAAPVFTGPGTDSSQNSRQNIGNTVQLIRTAVPLFIKDPDIGGYVGGCGTSTLAWNTDAGIIEVSRIRGIGNVLYDFQFVFSAGSGIHVSFLHLPPLFRPNE